MHPNDTPTKREFTEREIVWIFFGGFALGVLAMTAITCALAPYLIR